MTTLTDEALVTRLRGIVPTVNDEQEALAEWSKDWWPAEAKQYIEDADLPAAAVSPDTVGEVAAVVRLAVETGRPLMPRGGGSNLVGALEPLPGAIVVQLSGLNVIDPVNDINGTVRVDAGVYGGELEARLAEQGYTLGFDPASLHLSTVGGWVATGAAGIESTGSGSIDRLVVGIEAVLADGSIVTALPRPGRGAGPGWRELLAGSEGAFGIVTAVWLRVRPMPEARRFRAYDMPSFPAALDAIRTTLQRGCVPAVVRLLDDVESRELSDRLQIDSSGNLLMLMFEGIKELADAEERAVDRAIAAAGGRDLGADPCARWHGDRYSADWIVDGNEEEGDIADCVDVVASWDVVDAVIAAGREALAPFATRASVRCAHFHADGAAIEFTFAIERDTEDQALDAYEAACTALMRAVIDGGGGIAHHSGIGRARLPWLAEELGSGMDVLRLLKAALDPRGIMNPGRLRA